MDGGGHGSRNGSRTVNCIGNRFSLLSFMSSLVSTAVVESVTAAARMRWGTRHAELCCGKVQQESNHSAQSDAQADSVDSVGLSDGIITYGIMA